jgi:hypothetical protein
VGELDDAGDQPPLAGGEDAVVGVGEAGEIELREFLQGVLGLQEARLQLARRGPERGDHERAGRRRGAARIAQRRLARRRVEHGAPGREHGLGLAGAQPVAHEALGQTWLLRGGQAGQGVRGGGRQPPGVEGACARGGQGLAERQAPVHPPAPAAEPLGDLGRREVIVGGEGVHHTGLVHRADGALGRVGLEEPGLAHHAGERLGFHDHRDVGVSLAAPARQPLKAIEHLIGAVADRRHAHGQRGQRGAEVRAWATEWRERGGQPIGGDIEDRAHGQSSDSARTHHSAMSSRRRARRRSRRRGSWRGRGRMPVGSTGSASGNGGRIRVPPRRKHLGPR